jgi:hypothetical protein
MIQNTISRGIAFLTVFSLLVSPFTIIRAEELPVEGPSCEGNTAPLIRLNGPETVTLDLGATFTDPGAEARDAEDGNITESIEVRGDSVDTNTVGSYKIRYGVYDSCDAVSEILVRQVVVREPVVLFNNAPVITLLGDSTFFVELGQAFIDPGISGSDIEDGTLDDGILEDISRGSVDTNTAGVYRIRYGIRDSGAPTGDRKIDTTKRTVIVQDITIVDTDEDGVDDEIDNCPLVSNSDQADTDENGVGDACEDGGPKVIDTDEDGVDDEIDNCPGITNPDQTDTNEDGVGDACDGTGGNEQTTDTDEDGVDDEVDNCPLVANADQADADEDTIGDLCDETPNGNPRSGGSGGGSRNNTDDEETEGEVLGETTDESNAGAMCDYIGTYLKYGKTNDTQDVIDLQTFLNETEGETLVVDGIFGLGTQQAVHRLQMKHKDEILLPWGLDQSTGYVYILTKWFINNTKCPGLEKPIV